MQFSSLSTKPKTKMTKRNCVLLFGCYVQNQKCSRLTCRPRSNMKDESVRKPSRKWIFIPCHKKYSQTTTVWSSSQKPFFFRSGNLGYFSFWQWHFGTCTISQSHRKAPFSCQVLSQKPEVVLFLPSVTAYFWAHQLNYVYAFPFQANRNF